MLPDGQTVIAQPDVVTEQFLQDRKESTPASGIDPLPKEFLQPSWMYGLWNTSRLMGILFFLLALAPWMVSRWGSAVLLLLAPLVGAHIYKLSIVMHDCVHGSLFPNRSINRFVGHICGAFLATHFATFQHNHWEHHRLYGRPGDPQGSDYLDLQGASRRKLYLHLLKPLWGVNLYKLMLLNRAAADVLDIDPRITPLQISGRDKLVHGILILLTQAAILIVVTQGGKFWWLFWFYPVCAGTFALFFSQLRGFCEHVPLPDAAQSIFVRTHLPNLIDRLFFYDLNFNYHVEHHLYPSVPSFYLRTIFTRILKTHHSDQTLSPSLYHTVRMRLAAAPR